MVGVGKRYPRILPFPSSTVFLSPYRRLATSSLPPHREEEHSIFFWGTPQKWKEGGFYTTKRQSVAKWRSGEVANSHNFKLCPII